MLPALGIVTIVASLGLAFAWSADWLGHRGLTANQVLTSVEKDAPNPFPPGFRRAHGKGMCFTGQFVPTEQAGDLSSARVFSDNMTQVIGRFSLGAGDPHATDNSTRILSLSLLLKQPDGGEWRMAMINDSFFPTATVEGLVAMGEAFAPDSITHQPVPARIEAFYEAYPEARKYIDASDKAPWSRSFASTQFYSINAFAFTNKQNQKRFVRWSWQPRLPFSGWPAESRDKAEPQALFDELITRVANKPIVWDLIVTVADPSDPVNDPSQPWPDSRLKVNAGTLTINALSEQATGSCRDTNFDPTIVPNGVAISDDPILHARSGVYAKSFNLREREVGQQSSGKEVTQ
ncbi:catalase family peroxidase [Pseudomonas gozinkensis]|uniref:catalase family peroxidase n=1 Tax=Pseudomonas gozinkensis TaxID=2774461 RepID=UPI0017878DE7|nr:catalase family peroxidase [Pseudomonas gozinkensis]